MTRREFLELAIIWAVEKGFKLDDDKHMVANDKFSDRMMGYESIIFDHDFNRALWGQDEIEYWGGRLRKIQPGDEVIGKPAWKYHLQEMVLANHPIDYLAEHKLEWNKA